MFKSLNSIKSVFYKFIIPVVALSLFSCGETATLTADIRLNQIGYYPSGPKVAVVVNGKEGEFFLVRSENDEKVFTGELGEAVKSPFSEKYGRVADFSVFKEPGEYKLLVPGVGYSYPFEIKENVHKDAADAALKSFYYQRASYELAEEFAGKWKRPLGHPDNKAYIHASAASSSRPEGTELNASKGWYDAGDYNKYIVNSGITMGTMLSLYEDFPEYFAQHKDIHIPESGDKVPDLLDEIAWNLRWMLTMQDPEDGGVYHKLTTASFEGMLMPNNATNKRYFVQKGTAATLDFAAVMAQASRVYSRYATQFPGLSDSCITMAEKAWQWAKENPDMVYDQQKVNETFEPKITTGAYGDTQFDDEFTWAAAELLISTGDAAFAESLEIMPPDRLEIPSWPQVRLLGYYSLMRHEGKIAEILGDRLVELKSNIKVFADEMISGVDANIYQTVMGKSIQDFVWGSNAVAANQGVALIQAYKYVNDPKYLVHALANLDYILGRNGTGYSFLTGYGTKTPMLIHHRPSEADGVEEPVPGLLAGGPNPGQQDKCNYPSNLPDESFTDETCSYASNEIAINWNAPLVYLMYALESLQEEL